MKMVKRFSWIKGILIFIVFALISTASAQQKYAVLISAGQTLHDDDDYHSEYWYDLFLMYQMLIENGFTHNNIYVLYGNGNDFNSAHLQYQTATVFPAIGQITDYPNHKSDVANIFTWLANGNAAQGIPQIQPGDFLFYWWMGHGSNYLNGVDVCGCNCNLYEAQIENTAERIRDDEFAAYFSQLPACIIKTLFIMTCHSGGLIDELEGLDTMIHTATDCCIHAESDIYDVFHAELSYHVACAFREQDPGGALIASDVDGNGLVSVEETNDYAHVNTVRSITQIGDYRNTGPLIFIANAQPAATVPNQGVYSRDYAEDNGTEPSEWLTYTWFQGPDLWVRHVQDDGTENQDPEFGEANYVYARIHNIGCATLNVNVDLSWCEVSAWANPASWNPIDTATINNLESSETRVISAPWATVPAPGKYCLHTVLNAPGDPANADGRAFMDNNKVQINVDAEDNVPGWTKNFHWLIENGLIELARVDLVVEKLEFLGLLDPPKLTLEIPRDLKFDRLIGGELKESIDGKIIEISPKVRRAVLQGVILQPREKKEAILSVVMPKRMKLGESVVVKVSEQIKGREMGGIIFNTRAASQKQVMSTLFRRVGNLFKMLDQKFKVSGAMEISELCQEVKRNCRLDDPNSLKRAMIEVTTLESKIREPLSRLMSKEEFAKFEKALQTTQMAVAEGNIALFVESQEEMIFSTRPLFLQK